MNDLKAGQLCQITGTTKWSGGHSNGKEIARAYRVSIGENNVEYLIVGGIVYCFTYIYLVKR